MNFKDLNFHLDKLKESVRDAQDTKTAIILADVKEGLIKSDTGIYETMIELYDLAQWLDSIIDDD
jgi:hypothetical protein